MTEQGERFTPVKGSMMAKTTSTIPGKRRSPRKPAPPKGGSKTAGKGKGGTSRRRSSGDVPLEVPAKFGSVSLGNGMASVRIQIPRHTITLKQAGESFCKRRLVGRMACFPAGDDPGQIYLEGDGFETLKHHVTNVFDVTEFTTTPNVVKCTLKFGLAEVNVLELAHFSGAQGAISISEIEEIPDAPRRKRQDKSSEDD